MTGLVDRHPLKEKRRANKPLLERKRRARINDSLADLKHLVLSSLNKDVSKYAKMEKVDILDMTVRFLKGRRLDQRQDDSTMYMAGYRESTKQIYQNIMTMDGVDHAVKCRILSNLASSQRDEIKGSPPPSPTLSDPISPHSPPPTASNFQTYEPYPLHTSNTRLFTPLTQTHFHQKSTPSQLPPLIHQARTARPYQAEQKSPEVWRPW